MDQDETETTNVKSRFCKIFSIKIYSKSVPQADFWKLIINHLSTQYLKTYESFDYMENSSDRFKF